VYPSSIPNKRTGDYNIHVVAFINFVPSSYLTKELNSLTTIRISWSIAQGFDAMFNKTGETRLLLKCPATQRWRDEFLCSK
jgi:hypothetical protein